MLNRISTQGVAFLVVLGVLGATLITFGIFLREQSPMLANLTLSLGASLLGTSMSISFVRIFEPSQIGTLIELCKQTNRSSLLSVAEDELRPLRLRWHAYLRSRDTDGKDVWRYRIFDFSKSATHGHLHAVVEVPGSDGKMRVFIYDGYLCGHHLVLVGQPFAKGTERHVVHVFPEAAENVQRRKQMSGICFVDSYDSCRLLTPTVLRMEPHGDSVQCGVVSQEYGQQIYESWKSQVSQMREQLNFDPVAFSVIRE